MLNARRIVYIVVSLLLFVRWDSNEWRRELLRIITFQEMRLFLQTIISSRNRLILCKNIVVIRFQHNEKMRNTVD